MSDKILRGQVFADIDDVDREFWVDAPASPDSSGAPTR
jgi:hypothetical protein